MQTLAKSTRQSFSIRTAFCAPHGCISSSVTSGTKKFGSYQLGRMRVVRLLLDTACSLRSEFDLPGGGTSFSIWTGVQGFSLTKNVFSKLQRVLFRGFICVEDIKAGVVIFPASFAFGPSARRICDTSSDMSASRVAIDGHQPRSVSVKSLPL